MTARIRDGWIHGELPGPDGRTYWVEREPRNDFSFVRLAIPRPNLVLHTTQTPDLKERYKTWDFPPQFGVGDHRIVQLFPVWAQGKASKAQDARAMQIEITGFSNIAPWLPFRPALQPLVALVAFLHRRRLIKTGLSRPTDDWPIAVDHLPAAVFDYYRRTAASGPTSLVYTAISSSLATTTGIRAGSSTRSSSAWCGTCLEVTRTYVWTS